MNIAISGDDYPQFWEYQVYPAPKRELLKPFIIEELTDKQLSDNIKRFKTCPLLQCLGLHSIHQFETNRISEHDRHLIGRTMQRIYN